MRIGIVGASGFVGNRAIELLYPDKNFEVRPIIHSAASQQRLTLNQLDCRIANSFDKSSLASAFQGCDVIIHSILGSPGLIRGSIAPTYHAAQKAGVRRIIYLSSMIVHTCAPALGTQEETPYIKNQPFPTHNAKIDAEQKLLNLRENGTVEVVIFRPGIVFGPRSRWIVGLADQLSQGTAYFINEGKGICNSVYVDNLIHAIRLAMTAPEADGSAFFVGDREHVTWFDFYRPFAEAFGVDPTQIPQMTATEFTHSWKQKSIDQLWNSETIQRILSFVPNGFKQNINKYKGAFRRKPSHDTSHETGVQLQPMVTEMMASLQQSQYKLPFTKAQQILGYEPIVGFQEGCNQCIEWLASSKRYPQLTSFSGR